MNDKIRIIQAIIQHRINECSVRLKKIMQENSKSEHYQKGCLDEMVRLQSQLSLIKIEE